jgi:uncharacterized protein YggE
MRCGRILVAVGLALAFRGAVLADEAAPVRQISVAGTVETKTAPDQVLWQISLREADKNLQEAKRRSDEKTRAVLALGSKLGLGEGDLETSHLGVYREYERTQHGERGDFKHFAVSRSITIRQRDLKRFDDFLGQLLASTDMEVSYNLESSRANEVRAQARLQALKVAREKAAAMAAALGASLGPVLKIEEHIPREPWQGYASNSMVVESAPAVDQRSETFVPGALTLRVTVHVTFALK